MLRRAALAALFACCRPGPSAAAPGSNEDAPPLAQAPESAAALPAPEAGGVPRTLEPGTSTLANQRYQTGIEMYVRGDYAGAAREFRVGQALAPASAKLAYNLGRSLERAGDVPGAVVAYRRYLELAPNAPDRPAVEQVLAVLDGEHDEKPEPDADAPDARRIAAYATAGGAGVAALVGAIFTLRAVGARDDAADLTAADTERHAELSNTYDGARLGAGLGFGLAGALGVTAALLAFWPADGASAPTATRPPARQGIGLGWVF